ncbi:MAG TPA: ATP-binding cassette domain-containing protein [Candidatus Kapabacteria bacterium]|jgi:ABC-2 type transport system ATP-binding protein|nr:ATP-binding cassette domain-containing protein [Candidatus Kapabacteria bacterium]
MSILQTEALTRRFRTILAVDRLTIAVERQEIFGLLGPNGAGKSTAIKMLTTLLPPTSGTASVGDFDIVTQSSEVRRIFGYVPQALSADGSLTGRENLRVFARLYDIPRKEIESRLDGALELMGILDAADRLVATYSGGMIRRLEIAQATLHHPQLLFLDEPTIGLDPVARDVVWEHLHALQRQFGMTIFLTTHYMEEADAYCSRVAIMHLGKIAAIGTPQELKATIDKPNATLNDVFSRYAGDVLTTSGGYKETAAARRALKRLS